jgi:hypothetical protein
LCGVWCMVQFPGNSKAQRLRAATIRERRTDDRVS